MGSYIGNTPPVDGNSLITGSLTGNGTLFSTETFGFNTISIQLSGDWQALCTFQVSNDNTYWANVQGYTFNNYMNSTNTAQDNGVYMFPVTGRYFRVQVSNYVSGIVNTVSYLRQQSLAGIGEGMLTQAMDPSNGTPIGVSIQQLGQQPSVSSIPVVLPPEQIQDKVIIGKVFTANVAVNVVLNEDPSAQPNIGGWIDCTQYRSAYITLNQSATVASGAVGIEVSNDGINIVNNPVGFFDTQGVTAGPLNSTSSFSFAAVGATTQTRVGSIGWRYLRLRVTTAIVSSTTNTIQAFITLRATAAPYVLGSQMNVTQLNSTNLPSVGQALSGTTQAGVFPIGGYDYSVTRPDIQGAPYPIAATNSSIGPYWRRNYVDFSGNQGVAGPDPRYAEDKTYPVNVRLERTTAGQDSVHDLLLQLVTEQRAMNYYLRELPTAIAQMLALPNPNNEFPSSMQDEPENFASDSRSDMNVRGH